MVKIQFFCLVWLFLLSEIHAKFHWPWESDSASSSNRGINPSVRPGGGSQDDSVLTVIDSTLTEFVSDTTGITTDPRGEDGAKMFLGMVRSFLEYEAAQASKGEDNRPTAVFHHDLGWFYRNGSLSNLDRLPSDPDQIDTKFLLYTAPDTPAQFLDYRDPFSIQRSTFQANRPTVVITHGFKTSTGTASLQWVMLFVDALFRRQGPGNYFVVDWSKGAQAPDYWGAAANTQMVGAQLAKLLELLCRMKGANPAMMQLIGFSLGSHVSGFAGKRFMATGLGRIGKIFAMDAAGPLFEDAEPGGRLAQGDANLVVAEHGSADGLSNGGLGIWKQIGDVDCKFTPTVEMKSVPEAIQCNHNRNWLYTLQTFDPLCQFPAKACDNYRVGAGGCPRDRPFPPDQAVGLYTQNTPTRSRMFFETTAFVAGTTCAYHVKVTILSAKASVAGRGNFTVVFVDARGVETTPYLIAHDGRIPAGKQAFLLVRSVIPPAQIRRIKILYQRFCQPTSCFADTVNIQSVTLATVANDIIKTSCNGWDLVSGVWTTLDVFDRKCSKSSFFG